MFEYLQDVFQNYLDSSFFYGSTFMLSFIFIAIVRRYIAYQPFKSPGYALKKINSLFMRVMHWKDSKMYFPPDAVNTRVGYCKRMENYTTPPAMVNPASNMIQTMIGGLSSFAPILLLNFVFSYTEVMVLPFDPPHVLKTVLQIGLPSGVYGPRSVSTLGLYLILTICQDVFASIVPVTTKKTKVFNNVNNLPAYLNDFVIEDAKWELENVEDQLGDFLNDELKKKN